VDCIDIMLIHVTAGTERSEDDHSLEVYMYSQQENPCLDTLSGSEAAHPQRHFSLLWILDRVVSLADVGFPTNYYPLRRNSPLTVVAL
jgi:hypothetical protein